MTTTQRTTHTPILLERYKKKLVAILNSSLAWNYAKLPNNTFELQFAKYEEEIDEAIEAETISYQNMIEELADVLITIGGMARFDLPLAVEQLNSFLDCLDKYIFMDVVDYAENKIKILYKRSYSNGYKHDEVLQ